MPSVVTITTGARLHFGLLSHGGGGRQFGGIGMMIDRPGCHLTIRAAERDGVSGEGDACRRVSTFVAEYRSRCPERMAPPPCHIELHQAIASHAGLGSGTQLGLAVAQGMALVAGDRTGAPVELARRVGRGARSAIGIHGFQRGGLLVDGGKRHAGGVGALVAREEVPCDWRFVLITAGSGSGLSGERERRAFEDLPPMPEAMTARLCRIGLMELLPAVVEADCEAFGEAVYQFGRLAGESFAAAQGGTYASAATAELVASLRKLGVRGAGQSSWGPTVFAVMEDERSAHALAGDLQENPRWGACGITVAAALNTGAALQFD